MKPHEEIWIASDNEVIVDGNRMAEFDWAKHTPHKTEADALDAARARLAAAAPALARALLRICGEVEIGAAEIDATTAEVVDSALRAAGVKGIKKPAKRRVK